MGRGAYSNPIAQRSAQRLAQARYRATHREERRIYDASRRDDNRKYNARHDAKIKQETGFSRNQLAYRRRKERAALAQAPEFNPKAVIPISIKDGVVLVGSDAHIWPGERRSTALSAFQRMSRELQPAVTIIDGDWVDGARISRHARIGWTSQPKLADEIQQATAEAAEVQGERRIWALGNHDGRLETYLANNAPEIAGVKGASLRDHFPEWEPCWAVDINGQVMVRHKAVSAVPKTNTMRAGRTTVHGHLHAGNVVAFSDYNGTRWNVDCGTLAIPYGPQFGDYTEYGPVDWRSSFAVLTFKDGQLLWPELVFVLNEAERLTCFRGVVHEEE